MQCIQYIFQCIQYVSHIFTECRFPLRELNTASWLGMQGMLLQDWYLKHVWKPIWQWHSRDENGLVCLKEIDPLSGLIYPHNPLSTRGCMLGADMKEVLSVHLFSYGSAKLLSFSLFTRKLYALKW